MSNRIVPKEPPPLPEKIEDWERHLEAERTLNDLVEDVHRVLVNEDPNYRAYLRAVHDSHAVTGSLSFDNCKACELIQKKAKATNNTEVAEEKLGVINMALGVVLRRYHASRKQRRNMLGGKVVPPDNNGNDE